MANSMLTVDQLKDVRTAMTRSARPEDQAYAKAHIGVELEARGGATQSSVKMEQHHGS